MSNGIGFSVSSIYESTAVFDVWPTVVAARTRSIVLSNGIANGNGIVIWLGISPNPELSRGLCRLLAASTFVAGGLIPCPILCVYMCPRSSNNNKTNTVVSAEEI